MTTYQPFVGPHAEYYRRRTLQDAMRQPETVMRENTYLRERVAALETQLALCQNKIGLLESGRKKNPVCRLLNWLLRRHRV